MNLMILIDLDFIRLDFILIDLDFILVDLDYIRTWILSNLIFS